VLPSLSPGPSKDGALSPGTWDQFRMIIKKKIQPEVVKKIQPEVESFKRQASSSKP